MTKKNKKSDLRASPYDQVSSSQVDFFFMGVFLTGCEAHTPSRAIVSKEERESRVGGALTTLAGDEPPCSPSSSPSEAYSL